MSDLMNEKQLERARELFREIADLYRAHARPDDASNCIELAVRLKLWRDPAQRPIDYDPQLLARPVHDAAAFPVCAYLETHAATISKELALLDARSKAPFFPVEEPLLARGSWDQLMFYESGLRLESSARLMPETAAILDGLPAEVRLCGVTMISRLSPSSHIVPHCGFTNRRLRVHLGLDVPPDALMRVKDEFVEWRDGKCVVFDDSFEHEIWHYGDRPRVVLLIDIPHPQADDRLQASGAQDLARKAQSFLRQRGLRKIRMAPGTDRPVLEPDDYHGRLFHRMLAELNTDVVELEDAAGPDDAVA